MHYQLVDRCDDSRLRQVRRPSNPAVRRSQSLLIAAPRAWNECRRTSNWLHHAPWFPHGPRETEDALFKTQTGSLWPPYGIGRPLYLCPVISIFFFFFFLAKPQQSEIRCLLYFHTWCGLSANLECMSEMCCTRLAKNTGCKYRHFGTIAQVCQAVSSQLRHVSKIEKNC